MPHRRPDRPPTSRPAPGILGGLSTSAPVPTPAKLAAALAGPLTDPALGTAAAYVVDASTGKVLLDRAGNGAASPASTAKILLAATALHVLGAVPPAADNRGREPRVATWSWSAAAIPR